MWGGIGMSTESNVAEMPTDYWGWTGDSLVPLGICEDFHEACEKAETKPNFVWIFSREWLAEFVREAREELL
jgi:hypothetical protein